MTKTIVRKSKLAGLRVADWLVDLVMHLETPIVWTLAISFWLVSLVTPQCFLVWASKKIKPHLDR